MSALILFSHTLLRFAITQTLRSSSTIHLQDWMFVSGAQYLQIIPHCPISHLSLFCVCGKWTFMYCNRLVTAVLNSSHRVPPLCTFCTSLLSLQMFVLFDFKFPMKWTSHIPPWFQFESNIYVPFKGHWSVRDMNLNSINLQRYIMSHFTLL